LEQGRDIFAVPGNVTNRNSWGPNTLIKQGAKLTATCEDVWEELPSDIKLQLEANWRVESEKPAEASLFADSQLSPHQKRIFALLKPDEAVHLDEIIERLEQEVSSSEIFAALFELELAREDKATAGEELRQKLLSCGASRPRSRAAKTHNRRQCGERFQRFEGLAEGARVNF
jgi:DNA processing protein